MIGIFDIDMRDFDVFFDVGGIDNLYEFVIFKLYEDDQYRVCIDEIFGSFFYIFGLVVSFFDVIVIFNVDYNIINI